MNRQVKNYMLTPEDGHVLLLMESNPDERTFSDYPDLITCIDTIIELFEKDRVAAGQHRDDYEIQHVWQWIDEFHRIELLIFNQEISRYKRLNLNEFKQLFIKVIRKLEDIKGGDSLDNDVADYQEDLVDWDEE